MESLDLSPCTVFVGKVLDQTKIRRSITRPKEQMTGPDATTVLDALQSQEARHPGSVVVRVGRLQQTVILVGQDLLATPYSQNELELR
jgi:hypothetical protein